MCVYIHTHNNLNSVYTHKIFYIFFLFKTYIFSSYKQKGVCVCHILIIIDYQLKVIRLRMSFIGRYVYTYKEFVFVTAVQQNDSDRTKKHK